MNGAPPGRPAVTVALPVFNGAAFLEEAVDSVLGQNGWNVHLVAVDDGSTDDSAEILARRAQADDRISVISFTSNRGVAAARNAAIQSRDDPLVAMIDQDDTWLPNRLDIGWAALCDEPHLAYTTGHLQFEVATDPLPSWVRPEWLHGTHPGEVFGTMLAYRQQAWNTVGRLDETLRFADDIDWFVRARGLGIDHRMVPDVLVTRRVHSANASQMTSQSVPELFSILRRRHQ